MKIENKPKVTIPKKVREAMSLDELYSTGLTTPSIEKLILEKKTFLNPVRVTVIGSVNYLVPVET